MISFVVPVYNGEKYLRPCLDSILSQSMQDFELICVNDGSKDSSQRILEEYAAKDPRIRLVVQENQGVSAARNHGMELAKGEYLWFFDCDDLMQPDAAEKMLKSAKETDADIVSAGYRYYHQASGELEPAVVGEKIKVYTGKDRLKLAHISASACCKLWKRDFLKKNHLCYWPFRVGEDVAFFLSALVCSEKVVEVDCIAYYYRIYEGSSIQSYSMKELDIIAAFDRLDAFYLKRKEEDFRKELLFDRMFHYNLMLKRLPRHASYEDRREIFDALLRSREKIDFSQAVDRPDIMRQVEMFDKRAKKIDFYISDLYAEMYKVGRNIKQTCKKIGKNRG